MGQLLSVAIESGIVMLALYLIYKWILANENQYRFNRMILLSIYALSFVIVPMLSLFTPSQVPVTAGHIQLSATAAIIQAAPDVSATVWRVIVWLYLVGLVLVFLVTVATALRLISIIRRGEKHQHDDYTLVLTESKSISPFSWMHYIVMSKDDYSSSGDIIVTHEEQHICCHHWIDLLIAQAAIIVGWFNPAAWLLREELKSVHEYQADNRVLAGGTDARTYQLLLIKKAVGARFPSLANSLNHSKLKKRITMMNNQSTTAKRRLRALALIPAIAVAVVATDIPVVASAISNSATTTLTSDDDKGTQNSRTKITEGGENVKIRIYEATCVYGDSVSLANDGKHNFLVRVNGVIVEDFDNIDSQSILSMSVDKSGEVPVIDIKLKPLGGDVNIELKPVEDIANALKSIKHEFLGYNNNNGTDIKLRFSGVEGFGVASGLLCNGSVERSFNNINVDKTVDGAYIVDLHLDETMKEFNLIKLTTSLGSIAIPVILANDKK